MNHGFPWYRFESQLHMFYKHLVYRRSFRDFGRLSFVSPFSRIMNMQHVSIGNRVTILSGAWIMAMEEYADESFQPSISIGDNTYIGHGVTISCANCIEIGRDVTFGDNVYVADNGHGYEEIGTNIMKQRLKTGEVRIGDRAWIGKNAVIAFNLEIGEQAVVAANSFVNRSVPAYTVVAGNPAVAVKRYDPQSGRWISVKG